MEKQDFLILIEKYLSGDATLEEERILINFYGSFQQATNWDEKELGDRAYTEVKMLKRLEQSISPLQKQKPSIKLWPRFAGVAAILMILSAGVYFFNVYNRAEKDLIANSSLKVDIAPGKNVAKLTLSNGKVINLSEAKTGVIIKPEQLTYNDGTELNTFDKKEDVLTTQTISTPRGGTYQIKLADGTKVWLNAASSLTFPSSFTKDKIRKVQLIGEGYFEVAKDINHPFVVVSKGQEVEVLGTHFNINAYGDEPETKTSLLEGRVRVTPSFRVGQGVVLDPDQQSLLTGTSLKVKTIDADRAIDWKNGDFIFNEEPLESIMRKVSRWYDVEVVYEDVANSKILLGGMISRSRNLSAVLRMIESTGKVRFVINGRRLVVKK